MPDPGKIKHSPHWGLVHGARPLAELPPHIDAPDGQVSLVAGPMQAEHRMIYLVNRIRRPIRADGASLIRQIRQPDGAFRPPREPVRYARTSWLMECASGGPGYTPLLPAGAFLRWQIALPAHRQPTTVRFVGMYGLSTGSVPGVFDAQAAMVAQIQQEIQALPSADVAALALGVGLPELALEDRQNIRWAALLELQHPRHARWPERADVLLQLAWSELESATGLSRAAFRGLCRLDRKRGRALLDEHVSESSLRWRTLRSACADEAAISSETRSWR